jgi:hypothetical protein
MHESWFSDPTIVRLNFPYLTVIFGTGYVIGGERERRSISAADARGRVTTAARPGHR